MHKQGLVVVLFCWLLAGLSPAAASGACPGGSDLSEFVYPRHEERFADKIARIQSRLSSETFDVIGVGDSIMQRWPETLLSTIGHGAALNAGIGGDGVRQLLWRLDHVDWHGQRPNDVIVMIGTNDLVHGMTPCDILAGHALIRTKLASLFPGARLNIVSVLPRGADLREFAPEIESINAGLLADAKKQGFTFLDAGATFARGCGALTVPITCPYMQPPKNVHPTPAGYQMLFDDWRSQAVVGPNGIKRLQ